MKKVITAAIGGALHSGSLPTAGAANADVYYENCDASHKAGVTPLYEGIMADAAANTPCPNAGPSL